MSIENILTSISIAIQWESIQENEELPLRNGRRGVMLVE
jgi:hypothetical protein